MKNKNVYIIFIEETECYELMQHTINSVWSNKEKVNKQMNKLFKYWNKNDNKLNIDSIDYNKKENCLLIQLGTHNDYVKFWVEEHEIDKGSGL